MRIALSRQPSLDGAVVRLSPVGELPFFLARWEEETLAVRPPGRLRRVAREEVRTAAGWPVALLRSELVPDAGAALDCLHAFYRFVDRGAVAMVAAPGPWAEQALGDVRQLLLDVRVDLSGERVHCLNAIWEGF